MKILYKTYFGFILLMASEASFAGSFACTGKVENLFITRDGNVELYSSEIYGNGVGRKLCNTSADWKGVSSDTCKVWISTMLAQIAQKKVTKIYYLTDDVANCSLTQSYENSPSPWGIAEN